MKKTLNILLVVAMVFAFVAVLGNQAPVEAQMDLSGEVVTYWHVFPADDPQGEWINALIEEFNQTNEYGITVEGFDQGSYNDIASKMTAGIQSGDLPNLAMGYTNNIAEWASVGVMADMNQFVNDADYGLSEEVLADFYPGVLDAGVNADGELIAYPLSQSERVLIYNYTWAQELGFDSAPANTEELKAQLCAAAAANDAIGGDYAGTGGLVYYPSLEDYMTFFNAFGGQSVLDDGVTYDFSSDAAVAAAEYINDLRDSGCTMQTESYPNPEQAQRKTLITQSSSAGIKYYGYAFADEANEDVWGPIPVVGPNGEQVVTSYQQMIGMVNVSPEANLAAWIFLNYLTSPENQASWIEVSGYFPTRVSTEALIADYAANDANYAAALELIPLGVAHPQTAPAYSAVRGELDNAAAELYAAESSDEVVVILDKLTTTCNDLVAEFAE